MTRQGKVFFKNKFAGIIQETDSGTYLFTYDKSYQKQPGAQAISLTLPLDTEVHEAKLLFPFFDGLIPEGWLLDLSTKNWKLNPKDRMGLLLAACRDCIGAVHVQPLSDEDQP